MERRETLRLKNDLAELERIGHLVAALGARAAWPSGVAEDLELALDELVTNVISYAYDDGGVHEILIRITASAECVDVDLEDDGRPFDPTRIPAAATGGAIGERPEGGLGLHLVRSVVDELSYRRERGRNCLRIAKHIAPR